MPCRLSVNTSEYTLTDEHASTVSDEILDAARDGGGYVHIVPITGPEADVLITPATTVSFERIRPVQPRHTHLEERWVSENWPDEFS